MNIGKLDRRITIQRKAESKDSSGGAVTTWKDLSKVWASKADQGGREFRAAGTLLSETDSVVTIRHFTGLTTADRINYGGKNFDILSIGEIGRREGMILQCKTEAVK